MEEINQTPENQVAQPIQTPEPIKNKNVFKILFIISLVVILGIIIAFYFILNNKINQLENKETATITPTQQVSINNETVPTAISTIKSTESTLIEKDANNNLYTNNKFGFSLIIPKTANQGSCQKIDDSYTLNSSQEIPLTFFENQDIIYIAGEYFHKLTGEQKIPQGEGYLFKFSGCQKTSTTFELINQKDNYSISSFKIYTADIKNDSELEQFIKSKYGSGCKLGEKTQSKNTDIYDIKILGDGKDLGETKCPINFMVKTKYNQTKGKLVIFELGQACNLIKDQKTYNCYDNDIVDSLKFN